MKSVLAFFTAMALSPLASASVLNYDCGTAQAYKGTQFIGSAVLKLHIDEEAQTVSADGALALGPISKKFNLVGKITDSLFTDSLAIYWAESDKGEKVQINFTEGTEILFGDYRLLASCVVE